MTVILESSMACESGICRVQDGLVDGSDDGGAVQDEGDRDAKHRE